MEAFTQAPNHVLDNMDKMSNQCLRIVLAVTRKTRGWHKDEDRISISQFMQLTGMSNRGVIDGVTEAIDGGWIQRKPVSATNSRLGFIYSLVSDVHKPLSTSLVSNVHTQNKGNKVRKAPRKAPHTPTAFELSNRGRTLERLPRTSTELLAMRKYEATVGLREKEKMQ